jgi:tRNA-modifying protein YgfZ
MYRLNGQELEASAVPSVGRRPRAFVRVAGPQAEDYLQRMVSNDVAALEPGAAQEALLLTPKARVIAPLTVVRRAADDFLLLTEPELGETVRDHLLRFRFAARVAIELEDHASHLLLGASAAAGADSLAVPNADYGVPAVEVIDESPPAHAREVGEEELERLRIEAGTPRFGREIDDRVLPAEAGLVERAVSLTKGCYPGQEPIARLHYRGHANRALRVVELDVETPPPRDAELRYGGKVVGRVTSAARANGRVVALAYVRKEVPADGELELGDGKARPLH